jgi:hypothetical protein
MIGVAGIIGFLVGLLVATWFKPNPTKAESSQRQAHWTAVGGNVSPESVNAEWQQQIFRQMSKNRFFEIR